MARMRLVAGLICAGSLPAALHAGEMQTPQDSDWPCAQILVPEVPAAVIWAGPALTGMEEAWRQDDEVASLVPRLASPDYDMDAAEAEIADFSARQEASRRDHQLTLLFAGVLQTLNEQRRKALDGIMLYARGQAKRADQLSEELDEIVRLQDDPSPAAKARLTAMQKEMDLKQRMFDEREMFIQHLCTRPAVIEQKLGSLARSIAYYLDG